MNPMKMMKQFQQLQDKLQKEQAKLGEEMAAMRIEASSGGDMVQVAMNGKKEILDLRLDPEVVDKQEVEMLQEMIVAAIRECSRKVDSEVEGKVSGMTAGLTGGMKLPFGLG